MSSSLRYCAYYEEPLAGRADKVYCTSSCKSKDFCRQQAKVAPDEAFRPPAGPAGLGTYAQVAHRAANGRSEDEDLDEDDEDLEDAFEEDEEEADESAPARFRSPAVPGHPSAPRPHSSARRSSFSRPFSGDSRTTPWSNSRGSKRPASSGVLAANKCLLTGRELERLSAQVGQTLAAYQRVAGGPNRPAFLALHLADLYQVEELIDEAGAEWDEELEQVALGLKKKFRARLRARPRPCRPPLKVGARPVYPRIRRGCQTQAAVIAVR